MEHLFEYIGVSFGITFGHLGTLFRFIFAPSGHPWGHFGHPIWVQKLDGAPKVPQEALTPKKSHQVGDLLGPQITKSGF